MPFIMGWALRILSVILSILIVVNVFILLDDIRTGRLPILINALKMVVLAISALVVWLAFNIPIL